MDKGLPVQPGRRYPRFAFIQASAFSLLIVLPLLYFLSTNEIYRDGRTVPVPLAISRCRALHLIPGPPPDFYKRTQSSGFVPGTRPTLLKNAKIWTGSQNGSEVIQGDILLDKGLIKDVGLLDESSFQSYLNSDLVVMDIDGAWVTPGIVDMHSHLGDASSPELEGASDDNSWNGPVQPWLRSLDGLNTHDDSYALSIAGGVTTALVLPGSANAIGGQGFTIKLRKTAEKTTTSMLLEPPYHINTSFPDPSLPPRWRQMKQACGENPSAFYSFTRMDTMWAFREAYNKARKIKEAQDHYCAKVLSGQWADIYDSDFPQDLQWEALVDVLRGRVKVHTHCYEAVDLDGLIRLSHEFKFPIAAVHHASEAFLVPDLLKQAYGDPPGVALFATNGRYKREAFRASEFAPRILAAQGLKVAMKSDHPVLNSRYLLYEAQQAHYYGLRNETALSAVTSTPAELLGLEWRVGYVKKGWDADLVVFDSHPLALGATPVQVFIDGIPQLDSPHVVHKSKTFQSSPEVPNFDKDAKQALEHDGLPPLKVKTIKKDVVLFTNVQNVLVRGGDDGVRTLSNHQDKLGTVLVRNGTIACIGAYSVCTSSLSDVDEIDLKGGDISPGLVSFGSPLGLSIIEAEDSTNDGTVYDPLLRKVPAVLGGDEALVKAVDGLEYSTRDALLAFRSGVTSAITAPTHDGFYGGLSTHFSLSANHKLERGAIVQEVAGLHVSVRHFGSKPSVSTQIGALRRLLLAEGPWWEDVTAGRIPLVVDAHSADIIATLILLKEEVEKVKARPLKLTITGASEAHLLAKELGTANVGVIVNPVRPFPTLFEDRRILPGPPLTADSAISKLSRFNVTVGIGVQEIWDARNARFDIGWASLEADGQLTKEQAIALGSTNVEKLLGGLVEISGVGDLVATEGGSLIEFSSKVVAVISQGGVDLF